MQVAISRLGQVRGAEGLEGALRDMMLGGGLRTYIADMGEAGLPKSRRRGITCSARHAGARGVYILECGSAGASREFYLDKRHGRFCMLHTAGDEGADEAVLTLARATRLRRAFLGPVALWAVAGMGTPAGGNGRRRAVRESVSAERVTDDGSASATVRWDGAILSTGGMSARAHMALAGDVRDAYALMCSSVEKRYGEASGNGAPRHLGASVSLVPSRPIPDVPGLVGRLFTGGPPLLMEGKCSRVEGDLYAVAVVDRENSEYLGISASPHVFRVGIHHGRPGPSVLRLLGYMQLHCDPGMTCPDLRRGA